MKRKISLIFCIGLSGLIVFYYLFFHSLMKQELRSMSPNGSVIVTGLAFKGSSWNALDETLRLFVTDLRQTGKLDVKIQTKIIYGNDLEIRWLKDSSIERFAVYQAGVKAMEFQVTEDQVACIVGEQLIAPDPYKQQAQQLAAPER